MNYCSNCGSKLIIKETLHDGKVPYCPVCKEFRFPVFHSAISSIIFNPSKDKVLLIKQYGNNFNILVAGYINKGENANEALLREIKEETNLDVVSYTYNDNQYFEKSNTLIHNFITITESEEYHLNDEVDSAKWYSIEDALKYIKPNSLAKYFLYEAIHKMNLSEKLFIYEDDRIYMTDDKQEMLAEICFPLIDGTRNINRTYVSTRLRGLGIASKLMQAAVTYLKTTNQTFIPSCSYAVKWLEKHS